MKLRFHWHELLRAFEEIETAASARPLRGKQTPKGLWLVGDTGVYAMPNTTDGIHHRNGQERVVIYALECDPRCMSYDQWAPVKRRTFGDDDGIEFLDASAMRSLANTPVPKPITPTFLVVDFQPGAIKLSIEFDTLQ